MLKNLYKLFSIFNLPHSTDIELGIFSYKNKNFLPQKIFIFHNDDILSYNIILKNKKLILKPDFLEKANPLDLIIDIEKILPHIISNKNLKTILFIDLENFNKFDVLIKNINSINDIPIEKILSQHSNKIQQIIKNSLLQKLETNNSLLLFPNKNVYDKNKIDKLFINYYKKIMYEDILLNNNFKLNNKNKLKI